MGDKSYFLVNDYSKLLETDGTSKNTRMIKSYSTYNRIFVNLVATSKYLYYVFKEGDYYYIQRIDPVKDETVWVTSTQNNTFRFLTNSNNPKVISFFPKLFAYKDRVCIMDYIYVKEKGTTHCDTYFVHDVDEKPRYYIAAQAIEENVNFAYASSDYKIDMVGDIGVYTKTNDTKLYTFEFAKSNIPNAAAGYEKTYYPVKTFDFEQQKMNAGNISSVEEKNIYCMASYKEESKNDSTLLFELNSHMNFICKIPKSSNYIDGKEDYLYILSDKGLYQINKTNNELQTLFTVNKEEVFCTIQSGNKKLIIENGKVFFGVIKSGYNSKSYKAYDLNTGYTYELNNVSNNTNEKDWLHVIGDYYYYLRKVPKSSYYEIIDHYEFIKLNYKTGEETIIPMPVGKKETYWGILDFVKADNIIFLNVKYSLRDGTAEKRVLTYKP
jgi:hypothetical protein